MSESSKLICNNQMTDICFSIEVNETQHHHHQQQQQQQHQQQQAQQPRRAIMSPKHRERKSCFTNVSKNLLLTRNQNGRVNLGQTFAAAGNYLLVNSKFVALVSDAVSYYAARRLSCQGPLFAQSLHTYCSPLPPDLQNVFKTVLFNSCVDGMIYKSR